MTHSCVIVTTHFELCGSGVSIKRGAKAGLNLILPPDLPFPGAVSPVDPLDQNGLILHLFQEQLQFVLVEVA